jgi:hypothetical protein
MNKGANLLKRHLPKDDIFQNELARTYFSRRKEPRKIKNIHIRRVSARPALIAAAVVISASALSYLIANEMLPFFRADTRSFRDEIKKSSVVRIFEGGRLNRRVVKRLEFFGYAKEKSGLADSLMVLKNSKKYEWAGLDMDFKCPIDISDKTLALSAKGERGGEKISLVLKDSGGRSYRAADIYLTPAWTRKTVPLKDIAGTIDVGDISSLRLECGYAGEPPGRKTKDIETSAYIKDVVLYNS